MYFTRSREKSWRKLITIYATALCYNTGHYIFLPGFLLIFTSVKILAMKICRKVIFLNLPGRLRNITSRQIFKLQENTRDINSLKME